MSSEEPRVLQDHEAQLCNLVRSFLVLIVSVGASLTVITHISQICGISFSLYAMIGVFASTIVTVLVLWSEISKDVFGAVGSHPRPALALLTCCLLSTLLCLVSHRPDQDDFLYIPNVIYNLEHPNEPMGFEVHFIDPGQEHEPFASYYGCSLPFEHSQSILSYITGMHFFTVYYLLSPALFGCMIPLAWFYLISRFSFPPKAAITGAFFICLSLILMGEGHRSFGNLAFNRIFQGKTVMIAVGLPLFGALTIDFFRSACRRNWLYLFITSVAMIGLTTSATVLIPLLAFVLAFACYFSYATNMRSHVKRSILYFFTLLYPALSAVSILLFALGRVGSDKAINRYFPTTFLSNAKGVLGGPVVISFLVAGTISAIVLVQKSERRFLITWAVLVILLYLNPLVSPFVIKYMTSPNIYWRLFYLLPFPLVLGLSGAALALRLENKSPKWRRIVFGTAIVLLLAAHLPPSSSSVFQRRLPNPSSSAFGHRFRVTKLGLPRYKADPVHLEHARKVLALSPPAGSMLAMPSVSMTLPMLTSIYPQISTRTDIILSWMEECGRKNEGIHRVKASGFLEGRTSKEGFKSLVWVIRHNPQIRSIVADRRVAEAGNRYLFGLLKKLGFTERLLAEDLVVFIRPAR